MKKMLWILLLLVVVSSVILMSLYYQGKFGHHIRYHKTTFNALPAWQRDDHLAALLTFQQSCHAILKQKPEDNMGHSPLNGHVRDWQTICLAAQQINNPTENFAKQFFEHWFDPYAMTDNFNPKTLFTGYYLPLLRGSFQQTAEFNVPVYGVPNDLIEVKLAQFGKRFQGKKSIYGQLKGNTLLPYPDRAAINQGAITKNAKAIVWTDNKIDLAFAQIQGSALTQLPNGEQIIIGYAGTNGRPYTPIGKVLVQQKFLTKDSVSMQAIRTWLNEHPQDVDQVLNQDASYVFFNILRQKSPVGTQGVPLTPARSLAVDRHYIALGTPIWISTEVPNQQTGQQVFNRMLIAQDTGGAIKGMHNDIYWGAEPDAAFIAGHLKSRGKLWLLLPKRNARITG